MFKPLLNTVYGCALVISPPVLVTAKKIRPFEQTPEAVSLGAVGIQLPCACRFTCVSTEVL